ncbi:Uncharacterised protein [Vibrio cholerae]|nr:Uncharacterised protein [Vibrio cholerae]
MRPFGLAVLGLPIRLLQTLLYHRWQWFCLVYGYPYHLNY